MGTPIIADLDLLTTSRIAAVAGWLLHQHPDAARQWLADHTAELCTPYAIALLIAMLDAPQAVGMETEIRWRIDVLFYARRHGIARAWQMVTRVPAI